MSARPLTILSVAYPFARVGRDGVGGSEQILTALDHALVAAGHRSVVLACEGSQVAGELIELPEVAPDNAHARDELYRHARSRLDAVLAQQPIDLVHMHGIDFYELLPASGPAVLVTLHLPIDWYPTAALHPARPNVYFHGVSHTQHADAVGRVGGQLLSPICNGVDVPRLYRPARRRQFALCLTRVCPEKNVHAAIDACRASNTALLIGGQVFAYPEHRAYFEHFIAPRLDQSRRLLGPLSFTRKRRLLNAARCLLVPSRAGETSSLVAMEALACGTPVIGMRSGAVPEVVRHGQTGYIVNSTTEMAERLADVEHIDPGDCLTDARERFDERRMAAEYLGRYHELLGRGVAIRRLPPPLYRCELIQSFERLQAVVPAWQALWLCDAHATPFAHPAWLVPWWRHIATRATLMAVATWQAEQLVAFIPAYVYNESGTRKLFPIGIATTDYLAPLCDPQHPDALSAAWGRLFAHADQWDELYWPQVPEGVDLFCGAAPSGLVHACRPGEPCPRVQLPETMAELESSTSPMLRRNIRKAWRRGEELGGMRIIQGTADNVGMLLDVLIRLHGTRWSARDEPGVLAKPEVQRAHAESLAWLARAGLQRTTGLVIGDELAGVMYVLIDPPSRMRRNAYCYLNGWDPRFARLSPGHVLIDELVRWAVDHRFGTVDFLRGSESYKYGWSARDAPTFTVTAKRAGGEQATPGWGSAA